MVQLLSVAMAGDLISLTHTKKTTEKARKIREKYSYQPRILCLRPSVS